MKIKIVALIAVCFSLMGCQNEDNIVEDFGSTSVFFPFQTPVRTLVLGKYDLGFNDNDNNGRFEIGVVMSGVFQNKEDRKVGFEFAPDLIDAAALGIDNVNVQVLPASYYTIEQESPVTIPAGAVNGRIGIQLEDAFFNDPLSFAPFGEVNYVIPMRITNIENLDTVLRGVPAVDNPIKIKADDWNPAPKDYTLFGIKFMNEFDGIYLRRGTDNIVGTSVVTTADTGNVETFTVDTTTVYKSEFVVRDEIVPVITSGRNTNLVTNRVRRGLIPSEDNVNLNLLFENGNITVTNVDGDDYEVTGTGTFVENGDAWGGESRDVIYLQYEYRDVAVIEEREDDELISTTEVDFLHTVNDTLVIRNRDVKFETFELQIALP